MSFLPFVYAPVETAFFSPCYYVSGHIMKKIKIYCEDLEKHIDEDGCYDAKGSTICQACLEKPAGKKVNRISKVKKN